MQPVYQAQDVLEASIVKGLLEQYGIEVYISGFYLQGGVGELPASGNTALWVDDRQVSEAEEIIERYKQA